MKALYKYPQRAFPYTDLVATNRNRGRQEPEYELIDTGIFAENRYFDVSVEYAKVDPLDVLIRVSATNRGPEAAPLHLLPTLWFRNTWAWGYDDRRPVLRPSRPQQGQASAWCKPSIRGGRLLAGLPGSARAALYGERIQRRAAVGRREPHAVRQRRDS